MVIAGGDRVSWPSLGFYQNIPRQLGGGAVDRFGYGERTSLSKEHLFWAHQDFLFPAHRDLRAAQRCICCSELKSDTMIKTPSFTAFSIPSLIQKVKSESDCRLRPDLNDVSGHCVAEKKGSRNPGLLLCVCMCTCVCVCERVRACMCSHSIIKCP